MALGIKVPSGNLHLQCIHSKNVGYVYILLLTYLHAFSFTEKVTFIALRMVHLSPKIRISSCYGELLYTFSNIS